MGRRRRNDLHRLDLYRCAPELYQEVGRRPDSSLAGKQTFAARCDGPARHSHGARNVLNPTWAVTVTVTVTVS